MRRITLRFRTTTALFMHGADPEGPAELRAGAFKGLARYWFRAVAGVLFPLHRNSCPEKGCGSCVVCLEARVFGSAKLVPGTIFRIANPDVRRHSLSLLPHKGGASRGCFLQGGSFQVSLMAPRPTFDPKYLEAAAWSLWMASHLGGFGQRARRGAGSLHLHEIQPLPANMRVIPTGQRTSPQALAEHLQSGLTQARACIARLGPKVATSPQVPPAYPQLTQDNRTCRIVVTPLVSARSESEARKAIMLSLRGFKDHSFGSPKPRHASPVWHHLHGADREGFLLVLTMMKSSTLEQLRGNPKMLDDYLDHHIRESKDAREVKWS